MKPITCHREIYPTSSITISLRKRTRTGAVLVEVKSPADMVQFIAHAIHALDGLGQAMQSELRGVERSRKTERWVRERERLRKQLVQAYLEYRHQGHRHMVAVNFVSTDPRFEACRWTRADFRYFLPSAQEAETLLKHQRTRKR